MKLTTFCLLVALLNTLAGCSRANDNGTAPEGSKSVFPALSDRLTGKDADMSNSIDSSFRNYTKYNYIYGQSLSRVDQPFRYDHSAGIGSGALIPWDAKSTKPVTLRVVWAVVYDEKANKEQADSNSYDPYTNPDSPAGTAWCEAIVTIEQPYPPDPREIVFELFPDGTMKAHVPARSDKPEAEKSPPDYDKSASLPAGKYCLKEIPNPMYGLPKPKHYE